MLHIYHGSGKGKTSAAFTLALRQLAHQKKVLILQFLKDGLSGEMQMLSQLSNVDLYAKPLPQTFFYQMSEEEKQSCTHAQQVLWGIAETEIQEYDCIILDEILDAIALRLVDETKVLSLLTQYKEQVEIVLTGRAPSLKLRELADYDMEILSHKHPYEKGITARAGVEY